MVRSSITSRKSTGGGGDWSGTAKPSSLTQSHWSRTELSIYIVNGHCMRLTVSSRWMWFPKRVTDQFGNNFNSFLFEINFTLPWTVWFTFIAHISISIMSFFKSAVIRCIFSAWFFVAFMSFFKSVVIRWISSVWFTQTFRERENQQQIWMSKLTWITGKELEWETGKKKNNNGDQFRWKKNIKII